MLFDRYVGNDYSGGDADGEPFGIRNSECGMWALTRALYRFDKLTAGRGARESGSVGVDFEALELRGEGLVAGEDERQ